jgi:hypothetical protein
LQKRFYFDPTASTKGTLYLVGTYHHGPDEGFSGDDYLDLNLLTTAEEILIKDLSPGDSKWSGAIDALKSAVETFVPDPAQAATYKVGSSTNVYATRLNGRNPVAAIDNPDTAVDSYAVTASGQGTGFVTMVFGDGGNPDQQPQGDPVQVQVFRIADKLYTGDLKVLLSSNPLDEQVTVASTASLTVGT